jgi:hypothetical protein
MGDQLVARSQTAHMTTQIKRTDIHASSEIRAQDFIVRFEVFTAVTMKNVVFWDIKTHFVLHRRHITSPLQSPVS